MQINGDTGNHYNWEQLTGNSGVTDSFNAPLGGHIGGPIDNIALTSATAATATAGRFGVGRWSLLFYSQVVEKMLVGEGGVFVDDSGAGAVRASLAGIWADTAAITSLRLFPLLGTNLLTGSRFELYGV